MRGFSRVTPIGWGVAIGTLAALAAAMVAAAPSGAVGAEKVYESNFNAECVLAPGVLNEKGTVMVAIRGEGPERVQEGEAFKLQHEAFRFVLPTNWAETFFATGSRTASGHLVHVPVEVGHGSPAVLNLGEPSEFPTGIAVAGSVTNGVLELGAPVGAAGPLSSPPVTAATGARGASLTMTAGSAPGFKETSSGQYESTSEGILIELTGFNEAGEANIGPVQIACTAPPGVVVANPLIGEQELCNGDGPLIRSVEPSEGPTTGGTTVHITYLGPANENGNATVVAVKFGPNSSPSFSGGEGSVTAVTPPGAGEVPVELVLRCQAAEERGRFTYRPTATAEYKNWVLSGSLTDKKLGQTITLPEGSTFNGRGEVNLGLEGSVSGRLSIPPFNTRFTLVGVVPVDLGISISEVGSLEGRVSRNETIHSGEAILEARPNLGVSVTSVGIFGLTIPTSCATAEPVALNLLDFLSREELLTKGWRFGGSTSIPRFNCEGPFGRLIGVVLTMLVSGPEDPYSLTFTAPGG